MATKRAPRQKKVHADEQAIVNKLDALKKKTENREATEAEKKEMKELRSQLGALKFVRLAKQRGAKVISAIRNVGKLSGAQYVRTAEQVQKLQAQLTAELKGAMEKLAAAPSAKEKATVSIEL